MRKAIILILFGFLILPISSYAGITGALKGKVVDEDGKPLIGATVKVQGTNKGTYVKEKDGTFVINNLAAGKYEVLVTYKGKKTFSEKVTISADDFTKIIAKLEPDAKQQKM